MWIYFGIFPAYYRVFFRFFGPIIAVNYIFVLVKRGIVQFCARVAPYYQLFFYFFHSNRALLSATFSNFKADNNRVFKSLFYIFRYFSGLLSSFFRYIFTIFFSHRRLYSQNGTKWSEASWQFLFYIFIF